MISDKCVNNACFQLAMCTRITHAFFYHFSSFTLAQSSCSRFTSDQTGIYAPHISLILFLGKVLFNFKNKQQQNIKLGQFVQSTGRFQCQRRRREPKMHKLHPHLLKLYPQIALETEFNKFGLYQTFTTKFTTFITIFFFSKFKNQM